MKLTKIFVDIDLGLNLGSIKFEELLRNIKQPIIIFNDPAIQAIFPKAFKQYRFVATDEYAIVACPRALLLTNDPIEAKDFRANDGSCWKVNNANFEGIIETVKKL